MILKVLALNSQTVIGLEGAAGRIPIELFRGPSTGTNKEVGSFFLNTSLITGAEYAGFAAPNAPLMVGLEAPSLYLKNVAAVRAALAQQKNQLARIEEDKIELQNRKQRIYSPAMLTLDRKRSGYQGGTINIGDYLSSLSSIGTYAVTTPTISLFLKTWKLEKELNFAKAERERTQFLSELVGKLNKPDLDLLIQQSVALRSGAASYPDYYRLLKATATKAGMSLSRTPEFDRYIGYVLQADAIRPETLLWDVSQYEKNIWAGLCKTSEQRRLYQQTMQCDLTEKLVCLTMSSQEWDEYKPLRSGKDLSSFESFYEAAKARDAALSANLRSHLCGSSNVAVLVAGGFHSEGLSRLLAKGDVTLITVSPKLTQVDGSKENEYLNVFTRERTPLEKLFEAPKISIVRTLATSPIPGAGGYRLDPTKVSAVLSLLNAVKSGKLTPKQIGAEIYRLTGGDEAQMLALQEGLGWVERDASTGLPFYRYAAQHPWGKAGAVIQTAEEILSAYKRELRFSLFVVVPALGSAAIFAATRSDLANQIFIALAFGIIGLWGTWSEFRTSHGSHGSKGWIEVRSLHVRYSILSLLASIATYVLIYPTGIYPVGFLLGLLVGVTIYTVLHYKRNVRAAMNPAIAPLSGPSSSGRGASGENSGSRSANSFIEQQIPRLNEAKEGFLKQHQQAKPPR